MPSTNDSYEKSGSSKAPREDRRPTTRLGPVEFDFAHPQLDSSGNGKSATHEVIPLDDEDDGATVIQPMGREAREWKLRGECYRSTATELDEMTGEIVQLRHVRHAGDVYVNSVSTKPTGSEDENGWRYTYTVKLTEVI
jgi:hypothetical protein